MAALHKWLQVAEPQNVSLIPRQIGSRGGCVSRARAALHRDRFRVSHSQGLWNGLQRTHQEGRSAGGGAQESLAYLRHRQGIAGLQAAHRRQQPRSLGGALQGPAGFPAPCSCRARLASRTRACAARSEALHAPTLTSPRCRPCACTCSASAARARTPSGPTTSACCPRRCAAQPLADLWRPFE